jgi:hypothetical protein
MVEGIRRAGHRFDSQRAAGDIGNRIAAVHDYRSE